ncbi:MAG: DNA translocase FtsK 4TM domain-containing protein, partial [Thermaurantiacus tibetensis]
GGWLRRLAAGLLFLGLATGLALALWSHTPADPSLNTATSRAAVNLLGRPGALVSDLLLQGFGLAAVLPVALLLARAVHAFSGRAARRSGASAAALGVLALLLVAAGAGLLRQAPIPGTEASAGGLVGLLAHRGGLALAELAGLAPLAVTMLGGLAFAAGGLALALAAGEIRLLGWLGALVAALRVRRAQGSRAGSKPARPEQAREEPDEEPMLAEPPARPAVVRPRAAEPSRRAERERQPSLMLGDRFQLPPLALLRPPPPAADGADEAALTQNARLLEAVLEDYGVKGSIVGIAQGPVVTLYELEPAPGIKASRVIGLADDIARSMSAVSARVATIPGRNVIGIELPNRRREVVALSELIASDAFEHSRAALPLVLGKDIAGAPVVADLAPM